MTVALVAIAIVVGLAGFINLSQATFGVGILAAACLCAILARIGQAAEHQRDLKALLRPPTPPVA